MIVGLGIDLVEISRIERILRSYGDRFLRRLLHEEELRFSPPPSKGVTPRLVEWTAGRFSAKEAALKALGTGLAQGVTLHDIRITADHLGKPLLNVYGRAEEVARARQAVSSILSLTHTALTAGAVVIFEA